MRRKYRCGACGNEQREGEERETELNGDSITVKEICESCEATLMIANIQR